MLSEPLTLPCGVTIKNRIVKAAMSENMASIDHSPGDKFQNLYKRWAQGGAGIVITGNVMVDQRHLGELYNVVIEKAKNNEEALRKWAQAGTQNNTHLWMQINHPGKQTPKFLTKEPVAPSAIGYKSNLKNMFNTPRELSHEEIVDIIDRYAYAAKVAKESGFSGVQIHGAHGYLVAQFLSPLHNQRTDRWGGSLENRMNFVVEIYQKMREQVGAEYPIGIKINSADFQKGGFSSDESLIVMKKLSDLGIDLIEVSGGTYESTVMMDGQRESTKKREAYFSDFCEQLKGKVSAPILLTGGFRTAAGMNEALTSNDCQMVGLARSLAIDPDFANKLLSGEDVVSPVRPLSSGVRSLDKLVPIEITWYTQQLHRMGNGQQPKPQASVKLSILKTLCDTGVSALKRVRA
jgi:2,4-dienoyl-CoA reductase-like NADH-dependent reductase (Old Yellow Enzyme family)